MGFQTSRGGGQGRCKSKHSRMGNVRGTFSGSRNEYRGRSEEKLRDAVWCRGQNLAACGLRSESREGLLRREQHFLGELTLVPWHQTPGASVRRLGGW